MFPKTHHSYFQSQIGYETARSFACQYQLITFSLVTRIGRRRLSDQESWVVAKSGTIQSASENLRMSSQGCCSHQIRTQPVDVSNQLIWLIETVIAYGRNLWYVVWRWSPLLCPEGFELLGLRPQFRLRRSKIYSACILSAPPNRSRIQGSCCILGRYNTNVSVECEDLL